MQAIELRLGNLVKHGVSDVDVFHLDTDDRDRINYIGADNYEPIPLTEEWLEKLGLEKDEYGYWHLGDFELFIRDKIMVNLEYKITQCPKHVHQLQNLYFALTGEELKLK